MAFNSSEKEKLFAKSIPISVKDIYTNQTRIRHLFLTIEWQDSSPTMYNRKVLVLSLTDNDDPFFLYNLHLSEEDFQILKVSQDLLINFASFPQHIIDYIESCLLEEKNMQSRFVLLLTMNENIGSVTSPSQLDIVETNQFKNLIHLTLKFVAATEAAVRQYLTSFFRSLKENNQMLQNNLSFLEQDSRNKLAAVHSRLSTKEQELELLKKEMNVQLSEKDAQHSLNLQEERNQLISKHEEEEKRFEKERKDRDHNFKKQIQQLETRACCLESLNKELEDRNLKQESSIRELLSKILTLEDEARKLNETMQSLEKKYEKLKSELRDKESKVHHLEGKLCDAEKELRIKAQNITRLEDQIDLNARQVKNLKIELENLSLQLEVKEKTQKMLEEEKADLEKIILKLQGKVEEVKLKYERSARYKVTVEEKEKLLSDLRKETAELNMNLEAKNTEMQTLNSKMDFFQQKINSLEKDLNTKQNVIKFLNSELTKNCIIPQFSPSSVAQKELTKIGSAAHRKSIGSDNSPSLQTATNNLTQKTVRKNKSALSTERDNTSTPARFHMTDSDYCTSPSGFTQVSPYNLPLVHDCNFENGEIDTEALNAAFGGGDRTLKHSTAKKSTKSARSITPKPTKK